jgi:cyclopropane-fatty-acyl-phospholipid synthase
MEAATMTSIARTVVHALLARAAGGSLEVDDPWGTRRFGDRGPGARSPIAARIRVADSRFYGRLLREGSVGLGESYADGWWDADDLTAVLRLAHRTISRTYPALDALHRIVRPVLDPLTSRGRRPDRRRDRRNVRAHYDLGNELFEHLLDESMMYSCAIFESPDVSLAQASRTKLERLASLLDLAPGDEVLEIGTGWGGFALHAAHRYGCHVTTTTISEAQYDYARKRVADAGLDELVTVLRADYRDLVGRFDKLIAIEMIEAVDWREYDSFFDRCRALVGPEGVVALQAIVVPDPSFDRVKHHTDFIKNAIFPGGCLPSVRALTDAAARNGLGLTRQDHIGPHYAETLRRWRANLDRAHAELDALGYDERFVRLWRFYFSYCEAAFEERYVGDVQLRFEAPGRGAPNPDERMVAVHQPSPGGDA